MSRVFVIILLGFFFIFCILYLYYILKVFKILNYNVINYGMFKIKKNVGIFEDYGVVKVMKFVKYRIILILIYIDL